MKIDLTELRSRAEHINEQRHPEFPLILWNYSQRCQFDGAWDEYTKMCRGLITDLEGNIVARPFPKFFNIGQIDETKIEALLQLGTPKIYDKLDGSLGIQYYDRDVPFISTRGSFKSDQAQWATGWLRAKNLNRDSFIEGYTYLYEVIFAANRIVVSYGDRAELVLLAVVNTDTGEELDPIAEAKRIGLSSADRLAIGFNELLEKAKTLGGNEEGFVLHYSNGLRVKIKGEEYVRLHRLITGFSNKSIWELLKEGQSFDEFLERVPDEFYQWVKETKEDLERKFKIISEQVSIDFITCERQLPEEPTRKEWAEIIKTRQYPSLLFLELDDKDLAPAIWKLLRPVFAKPFRRDVDNG